MIRINELKQPLDYSEKTLKKAAARALSVKESDIITLKILRRSVDARKKENIGFVFSIAVKAENEKKILSKRPKNCAKFVPQTEIIISKSTLSASPIVVGFGPAGFFAALMLARAGARPIVLERGKPVDERKKSVEVFREKGILDPECNVQFGEGGAGTFSDGKLNTGTKDPRIFTVLSELYRHGAPEEIMWQAKPHIGTDRLSEVVKSIRKEIISLGGEIIFGARFSGFVGGERVSAVSYEKDEKTFEIAAERVILATGHSSRDTFEMLHREKIAMAQKPFAVGVRIEHLQSDIDKALYGSFAGHKNLGAADYKLVAHLPSGRSIYSFCMCPGGYVMAAASEECGVVTNGMSLFARDGINANSALLTAVEPSDLPSDDPLAGIMLQREIEKAAFRAGGGNYGAPVSLVGDFLEGRRSTAFGRVKPTYLPSTNFALPDDYLPDFAARALREGIPLLGRQIKGFDDREAVLIGAESRSSSPVRINRGENGCSLSLSGLYPCGEGAGYAGGIVSAAVDGIRIAEAVLGSE